MLDEVSCFSKDKQNPEKPDRKATTGAMSQNRGRLAKPEKRQINQVNEGPKDTDHIMPNVKNMLQGVAEAVEESCKTQSRRTSKVESVPK